MAYNSQLSTLQEYMTPSVQNILRANNGCIAGGAVTSVFSGSKINDLDIYFKNNKDQVTASRAVSNVLGFKDTSSFCMDRVISVVYENKRRFQFIDASAIALNIVPDDLTDVIKQFDFTICQGAFDVHTSQFKFDEGFFTDLCARRLRYNINSNYPLSSLWRLKKFMSRGYNVPASELIKIGLKLNKISIHTHKDLKEHLLGIDTLLLKPLTDMLEGKGDTKIDLMEAIELIEQYLNESVDGQ